MSTLHVALLALVVLLLAAFDRAAGDGISSWTSDFGPRRSLLRDLGGGRSSEIADAAVELNSSTFDAYLGESPARFAVVEFFASWCPACRNYKPQYEKVAKIFNGASAVHPGIIVMTRVDCAQRANGKLCDRFSVSHYPTLLWAPPAKFRNSKWTPGKAGSGIEDIDIQKGRTAQLLLDWINDKLGSSFSLIDEKFANESTLLHNISDPEQISRALYDVEEATVELLDIIFQNKMIKPKTQAPLIKFLQLIVAHHPSKRCRRGTAEVLVNFDELWSSDSSLTGSTEVAIHSEGNKGALDFHICGTEVPRGYWIFCRGSRNDTRGFSCGLWILLHSLTVRVRDDESALTFTTICDFIHNFFLCEDCRRHFYGMCSSVGAPPNNTRKLVLWLWRTHNQVNERLIKEERESASGDPKFPKTVWPSSQLCPSCRHNAVDGDRRGTWNEDEVFRFLGRYYGTSLAPLDKSGGQVSGTEDDVAPTTSAVAVPVGAALGIALASCAFGALACFWRTQQKKRKHKLMKPAEAHY
ncbi:sulfhydryl oxidase 1-like [Wolffia australiana]